MLSTGGRPEIERAIGVRFRDASLRDLALTHRSYAFEQGLGVNNERLEFLGDAVLGLVVAEMAYASLPEAPEGELAKLRAAVVNMNVLAEVARQIELGAALFLGKGEEASGGRDKSSILADTFEALLGAVYIDQGPDAARGLVTTLFRPRIEAYVRGEGERDFKGKLQEYVALELSEVPVYRVEDRGPDHRKEFTATVYVAGRALGTGEGASKKEAEQRAAREAYASLAARAGGGGA